MVVYLVVVLRVVVVGVGLGGLGVRVGGRGQIIV